MGGNIEDKNAILISSAKTISQVIGDIYASFHSLVLISSIY